MGTVRLALEAFKAGSKVWDGWVVVAWYASPHPRRRAQSALFSRVEFETRKTTPSKFIFFR